MITLDRSKAYRVREGVVTRRDRQGNCLSLYDPFNDHLLEFNNTAGETVKFLDGTHTMQEIINRLAAEYEIEPAAIEADIDYIVHRLMELGTLEEVASGC